MAEVDPPEQLRQPQLFNSLPSVFLTGPESPTHPSIITLSDSEPDLVPKPIFEPDEDHLLNHRHVHGYDQASFFTNFFQRSSSQDAAISGCATLGLGLSSGGGDPTFRNSAEGGSHGLAGVDLDLGLGLGFGNNVVASSNLCQSNEGTRRCFGGLRVVNIDDDSDSESEDEVLRDDGVDVVDDDDGGDRNLGFGGVSDFDRPPYCWDYLGFNNGDRSENCEIRDTVSDAASVVNDSFDEFFVEEVVVIDDDDDEGTPIQLDTDVSNVFDTYQMRAEQQEITIDSDTDGGEFGVEEAIRDLEWEILLAVNNFNREVYDMDFNVDMYETILGEVEDRMNEWRGSPPTAESVIENLPSVLSSNEGSEEDEVVCAVCKDEISEEEVVKQLPCSHYYHGECIIPWLRMRNTCPVCRNELPTDDAEYEYRKWVREREEELNVVANEDLSWDSQEDRQIGKWRKDEEGCSITLEMIPTQFIEGKFLLEP